MTGHDDATAAQIAAIAPDRSTWLSANAGSGKTRVLTTRVALLLLGGTDPQNILCLTYTKAAASEMQNRLFGQLGKWAMMADEILRESLRELGAEGELGPDRLARARTLFAAAIEAPGGLRIQTIHSFCSALLRRFPLEAGITPLFRELDDRAMSDLWRDVLRGMAAGPHAGALAAIAGLVSDSDLTGLARTVAGDRAAYRAARSDARIRAAFGLPELPQAETLMRALFSADNIALLRAVAPVLAASGANDQKTAEKLAALNFDAPADDDDFDILVAAFLFGSNAAVPFGPKVSGSHRVMGADARTGNPGLASALDDFMQQVASARPVIFAERAAARTIVLEHFARAFLGDYAAAKAAGGWLDFDDLIEKATDLLTDRQVADWVMFRLDGGIEHILVDEAQDTSPAQWRVIQLLAQDFGTDAQDSRRRTIFVVGDQKQSIYSFQGADPAEFEHMRAHFDAHFSRLEQPFQNRDLHYSFRSSPAVLAVVDRVFADIGRAGFGDGGHMAHKSAMPGRVDVWPVTHGDKAREDVAWDDPQDLLAPADDKVVLANRIADEIAGMLDGATIPAKDGGFRKVRAGDFLILVQRRSALFHEIIRACKARGLPIAGADRLRIGAELAVRDLKALISFVTLPQDDLSLAALLRSPLLGFSEQQLFDLAHRRGQKHLWQALEARQGEFAEACALLHDLRDRADFMPPYEFLERALTRWGGRVRLLARLGPEAAEGVDALLALAQDYEAAGPASLTGFIGWLDADETSVKRQAEAAGDKIRVMTTHGAKGLESAIVILPETHEFRRASSSAPLHFADGTAFWPSATSDATEVEDAARAAAEQQREEERLRLLYVAMTRAESWLIVAGYGGAAKKADSWHDRVTQAVMAEGAVPLDAGMDAPVLRHQFGEWSEAADDAVAEPAPQPALPGWVDRVAPAPPPRQTIITPSKIGEVKSLPGAGADAADLAAIRGTAIHLLLEHLPAVAPDRREAAASALLASRCRELPAELAPAVIEEVLTVLSDPAFAQVFAAGTLAEVAVSAPFGRDRIAGVIDRLIVTPDRALIVDFKSNAQVPDRSEDTPDGIVAQMAAYHAAIAAVYPDRAVEVAILWTAAPKLMALPHDMVMNIAPGTTTP